MKLSELVEMLEMCKVQAVNTSAGKRASEYGQWRKVIDNLTDIIRGRLNEL